MSEERRVEEAVDGGYDHPDGLLHKKKKKKNKDVAPDTVTKEDEENMAIKRLLELETELMGEKSLKRDLESEIIGLKTELSVLEKNYTELQEKSRQSLEAFQKFELEGLSSKIGTLTKEKEALVVERDAAADREKAKIKEIEYAKKELSTKEEEIQNLKTFVDSQRLEREEWTKSEEKLKKENEDLKKEAEELKQEEKTNTGDMSFLRSQLEKVTSERDSERLNRIKTSERLTRVIDDKNSMEASFKLELSHMETDLEELKIELIHVTKGKEEIWDKFSKYLNSKGLERWVSDQEKTHCENCKELFTFKLRKHHCRLCGFIFCKKCSDRWLFTPQSRKRIRACDVCADAYTELKADAEKDVTDGVGGDGDVTDGVGGSGDVTDRRNGRITYRELKGEEIEKYEAEFSDTEDSSESQ